MKIWHAAGLAVVLVLGVAGLAWVGMRRATPAKVEAPGFEQKVVRVPAEQSFACRVVARETVAASTPVSGAVDRVLVDVGMGVVDGQVLAVIGRAAALLPASVAGGTISAPQMAGARREAAELQASVTRLRVRAAAARVAFEKQELLNRAGVTPRLVFENARAERDRMAAELSTTEEASRLADNAVAKLEDLQREQVRDEVAQQKNAAAAALQAAIAEVHAPVAGMVVERNIAAGELVTDANRAALFRIAPHPELLRAEFAALAPGRVVAIRVGDVLVSGTVGEGGTFADFESRTAVVAPGSPCTVTIK
jgi:multidrug efflux pump subunit AcrA (membrane-fusion protein)